MNQYYSSGMVTSQYDYDAENNGHHDIHRIEEADQHEEDRSSNNHFEQSLGVSRSSK